MTISYNSQHKLCPTHCWHEVSPKRNRKLALATHRRLFFEPLEHRHLLATVAWAIDSDGFWDEGANWDTGTVPQPGDDVVIDRPAGDFTITHTHRSGTTAIRNLTTTEQIVLSGGILSATDSMQIASSLSVQGGTLQNTIITAMGGSKLIASASGGVLDGVTLNGDLDLVAGGAAVTVVNGLTLNGTASLNNHNTRLHFSGTQSLSGSGTVVFGDFQPPAMRLTTAGTTLTIGAGITVRGGASTPNPFYGFRGAFIGQGPGESVANLSVINHGMIAADLSGGLIVVGGQSFSNTGILRASNGGVVDVNAPISISQSGILSSHSLGSMAFNGNVLGETTNADQFVPSGTVRLDGVGTAANPQLFEAMSADVGAVAAGFERNFAYGTLALSNNTFVRLMDSSDNAAEAGAEAVYAASLIVPAGTTLDLNGLNLYVRSARIDGTVQNGAIQQVPDSGPILFNTSTPGAISAVGETDEWTFFGRQRRSVAITVNPGPLFPPLNFAGVDVLDPQNNVLATRNSSAVVPTVTLDGIALPSDGVYRIRVRAATSQPASTGNYSVALWDATIDRAPLFVNQRHTGAVETPFTRDQWTFFAMAGDQVRFDLIGVSDASIAFDFAGPNGWTGFNGQTDDSMLITLPETGEYVVSARGLSGQWGGSYTFQLDQTPQADLTLGISHVGMFAGNHQAQLYRLEVPEGSPLTVILDDSSANNRSELYLKYGSPPTRADFDHRSATLTDADQRITVTRAVPGTWFILVYGNSIVQPSDYTVRADAFEVLLKQISPDHHADTADAVLTITGAGFDSTTQIELIGTDSAVYPAADVQVDLYSQITATFAAGSVPVGTYSVRARISSGASFQLPDSFRIVAGGEAVLETDLILPAAVGRHALATIYVEYANTGTLAMPAPLLVLRGSDRALMTLQQHRLSDGFWTSAEPAGFSDVVQFLGSGATPGVLQPGERMRIPVYFAGLLQPWDFSDTSVNFNLEVLRTDNTTPIDWPAVKEATRPESITAAAWNIIAANLESQVGATWGDYVRMLADNAAYLGRIGQQVVDVYDLWNFEVQQAYGLNVVGNLASQTDIVVSAPGLPITFRRVFSPSIIGRHEQGPLGRGWYWTDGWQERLAVLHDGTLVLFGADGSQRRWEPDSRLGGGYFSQAGDHAQITATCVGPLPQDCEYTITEANGLKKHFDLGGLLQYIRDPNGNQITFQRFGPTLGLPTFRILHSAGQFLDIYTNTTGLVERVTASDGRSVFYTYDATNEYLLSVTGVDGQTTHYTYESGTAAATRHSLLSIEYSDATHQFFAYDAQGRLASMARDAHAERLEFGYDSTGRVTVTDASGATSSYFFDHRGGLAASEDPLGNRTVVDHDSNFNLTRITDPLGQSYAFTYDARGNLVRGIDPLGQITTFSYTTNFNRLASVTDANGNPLGYGYDSRGNLISITYANGSIERFTVDARGELDTSTNPRGQVVDAQFDAHGRLERQDFPDGSFREFHYNARGNLDQALAPEGITQFEYLDPLNPDLPTKITYPNGRFLAYTYEDGRRTSLIHPDGFTVKYLYDAAGRLEFLRDGGDSLIVQYQYDAASRLVRRTNGNGTFTEYQYDPAGQIERLINRAPDGSINSRFDYIYDALGRRTRMTTLEGVWDYTYDATSQLTRAIFTSNNAALIANQDLQYVYDAVGNRIRTIINGMTTEYTTNNLNQYTQVGPVDYTYDADGNLIAKGSGPTAETFTFDASNRLIAVETPAGDSQYEYDAFGNRSATVEKGERTEYIVDPFGLADVVATYTGGASTQFVHAFNKLVSRIDAGASSYYDFDALNSTAGITNTAGSYVNEYAYFPFGERLVSSETIPNPFEFVSGLGVMQESSGLEFMRARFYTPLEGRFISQDPIGLAGGQINVNAYVANGPVNSVDPSGLDDAIEPAGSYCQTAFAAAGSAVGAFYGGVFGWVGGRGIGSAVGRLICPGPPDPNPDPVDPGPYDCPVGWIAGPCDDPRPPLPPRPEPPPAPPAPNPLPPSPPPQPPLGPIVDCIFSSDPPYEAWCLPDVLSQDPNEKTAHAGVGPGAFVRTRTVLPYRVDFENDAEATAPAQRVVVTDQLDSDLDRSTFEFTEVGVADVHIAVPADSQYLQTTVPVTIGERSFDVEIELSFDPQTGMITSVFQSIDPQTGLPPDVLTGFLSPEDGTGRGQGFISFTVEPKAGLTTGTEIRNIALITFDVNQPIATNQVDPHDPSLGTDPAKEALNTIDAVGPASSILPLPTESANTTFTLAWSGQDDAGGSGIASYDIYVSTDGGQFLPFLVATTATDAAFTGEAGRSYAFYSVASDNVGHVEAAPAMTDATTFVASPEPEIKLEVDQAFTTVNEGSTANNTGRYGEAEVAGVALTASVGAILDNGDGRWTWSFDTTDGPDQSQIVTITAISSDGAQTSITFKLVVDNVAPSLTVDSARVTIVEGAIANNSGSIGDVPADTITLSASLGSIVDNGDRTWSWSYDAADDLATTITVTATDSDGAQGSTTFDLEVNNEAPVIEFLTAADFANPGSEGIPMSLSGQFVDDGTLDTHTAVVDWGDGSLPESLSVTESDGSGSLNALHTYAAGGIYTITVTLFDDDGGSHVLSTEPVITGAGLRLDGTLIVVGTSVDDQVTINKQGNSTLKVHADFLPGGNFKTFDLASVKRIMSYLGAGDDNLSIAENIDLPAVLHGQDGNDHLKSGAGLAVLLGGTGNDTLNAGGGRSVLIGGTGQDRLKGGTADDILAGGSSALDANDLALLALLNVWNGSNYYAERVAAVVPLLGVEDDGEADTLSGSSGRDLYFSGLVDSLLGVQLTGRRAEMIV